MRLLMLGNSSMSKMSALVLLQVPATNLRLASGSSTVELAAVHARRSTEAEMRKASQNQRIRNTFSFTLFR